jgi:hypothetical protein
MVFSTTRQLLHRRELASMREKGLFGNQCANIADGPGVPFFPVARGRRQYPPDIALMSDEKAPAQWFTFNP